MPQKKTILAHLFSFAVYLTAAPYTEWQANGIPICDIAADSGLNGSPRIAADGEEGSR